MDEWVTINGFPNYIVNPLGQIVHERTGHRLMPYVNQWGAVYVSLHRRGIQVARSLPLLVASHFIPQPNEHFDTVINLNGDRFDCAIDNLAWRPRWFALQYTRNFREPYERRIKAPLRLRDGKEVFRDSLEVSMVYGLLEREVVLSVLNGYPVWPTHQQFEFV